MKRIIQAIATHVPEGIAVRRLAVHLPPWWQDTKAFYDHDSV